MVAICVIDACGSFAPFAGQGGLSQGDILMANSAGLRDWISRALGHLRVRMNKLDLLHRLVYLDRDYIAGAYEAISGTSAQTLISKTEGKKAGVALSLFNGELSAGETRAFSLSTIAMLKQVLKDLEALPELQPLGDEYVAHSKIGWIEGDLSVKKVVLNEHKDGEKREVASQKFFGIDRAAGGKVALLTTPEYFSSGIGSYPDLYETMLGFNRLRVRMLARAYPAATDFKEEIVVPLVILE